MSDRPRIGLDNAAFAGRLRQPTGPAQSLRVATLPRIAGYTHSASSEIRVVSRRANHITHPVRQSAKLARSDSPSSAITAALAPIQSPQPSVERQPEPHHPASSSPNRKAPLPAYLQKLPVSQSASLRQTTSKVAIIQPQPFANPARPK